MNIHHREGRILTSLLLFLTLLPLSASAQTMSEVRQAMQINYFDDEELIRSQAEAFRAK